MIIKKIAKMCRKQGTILSLYKNDTLWMSPHKAEDLSYRTSYFAPFSSVSPSML